MSHITRINGGSISPPTQLDQCDCVSTNLGWIPQCEVFCSNNAANGGDLCSECVYGYGYGMCEFCYSHDSYVHCPTGERYQ